MRRRRNCTTCHPLRDHSQDFWARTWGISIANPMGMASELPAKNHRELIVWQLCAKLRSMIWKYTRDGPAAKDRRYCDQIRPAARSACYCTSEGFYRKRDGDFLNFLIMARASLGEIDDQLDEGLEIEYFTNAEHGEMKRCLARACRANRGLREYLERCIANRKGPKGPKGPDGPSVGGTEHLKG